MVRMGPRSSSRKQITRPQYAEQSCVVSEGEGNRSELKKYIKRLRAQDTDVARGGGTKKLRGFREIGLRPITKVRYPAPMMQREGCH